MSGFRGQLRLLVAATMLVVLLAFLVPLALLLRRDAEQRAISAATLRAQSAAALLALDPTASVSQRETDGSVLTVFLPSGQTAGAPADRTPSIELAAKGSAFVAESGDGVEVLVPVQGLSSGTAVVRVFVPGAVLHAGVTRTVSLLALLGFVLLAFGLLVADRLGRRLVTSVTGLAATAERLADGDLHARAAARGTRELTVVGTSMNRLAARIGDLLAAERERAANVAHRLRTPITALRLDVESVPQETDRARLLSDVEALNKAVHEVIRTARRPAAEETPHQCDLGRVAVERVNFWQALAEDTSRPLTLVVAAGPIPVPVAHGDLGALLDTLLENAFSHTPDDVAVRVEVSVTPTAARLVVSDDGPGFEVVPSRGVSGRGSTGLGLDIARQTARAAGGSLDWGAGASGGAEVVVTLPIRAGGRAA